MLPKEIKLEEYIENYLVSTGYEQGCSQEFDFKYCLFTEDLFRFLNATQEDLLNEYKSIYGATWKSSLLDKISSEIRNRGLIAVLRHGFEDMMMNGKFHLFYNKPNSTANPDDMKKYKENIFKVVRQLKYSDKHNNTLDMVISLNGFPIVVLELKNQFTGQNVQDAINQYRNDRNPKDKLFGFNERVLVYFAVDTDNVYMTTELKGAKTYFLPFNRGWNRGKGNPTVENKVRTCYLWEDILRKDSLLDIVKRFYFIEEDSENKKKTAIFPRYHQLDAVRKMVSDLEKNEGGLNYLIQHSAGSGKTKTIAWTAHRVANLQDSNNDPMFDSVIVVTDRKVLDRQLQDAIYQLDHKHGVVVKIDKGKTSTDLAKAIESNASIIITTIQKFPYALAKIKQLEKKKYAVIIDEAHSSTAGENMSALKETLAGKTLEEAAREEALEEKEEKTSMDKMAEIINKRTDLTNISFFAFTATPKAKTLEIFGRKGEDGKPHEFHLYSMKQAIEEGFILDVLKNYMTASVYYKVRKKIEDNPEFDKGDAKRAIRNFVSLTEHNIRQKVETIVDDFVENRMMWIDGEAKAMVVTPSRLHAVRYKIAIDKYVKEKGYNVKTLVAFSGTVTDEGESFTEESMNENDIKAYAQKGSKNIDLAKIFKKDEFKILVVADKYQTGFDEKKLCVMYVDKKLDGVKTVQTLSRLNRTYPNKKTFILDFQNDVEDIKKDYEPYFEMTNIEKCTNPNVVNDLWYQLQEYGIYRNEEVNDFAILFYKDKRTNSQDVKMNSIVDAAVERFEVLNIEDEKKADEFKKKAQKYITFYNFLLQIYPLKNLNLLRLQVYLVALLKKLHKKGKERIKLDDMLELDYYKLEKLGKDDKTGIDISLTYGEGELVGISETANSRVSEEHEEYLDDIIKKINDIYGIGLTEDDKIIIDHYEEMFKQDKALMDIAKANSYDDLVNTFAKSYFKRGLIKTKKKNDKLVKEIFGNHNLQNFMINYLAKKIYDEVNK
ncbi:type I restriction endonuclease subunit R [Clostridium perfringens]|uniref:type I restriction endonuclease subunit R n=1 Tax=Clostridium perfringens TaxID=1502 RepID=UPI0018E415F2|nr:type I restriction endonuclease [Clostridium perfringens]MBI6062018.1 type I restriction endonuclease subunit R [Clostridium perfringens]MBI6090027.1 type I restriction endonuclease subunit R [Clostridium perfringens]MDK0854463.1 type I restriction endonuclease [Clostridium perfringens]MDK0907300.1 type I restriction endonuclease [Clostridium perfringens]MDZ4963857.1 DEAD/DEAH box helicase [Clostridium perfringens]